MTSIPKRLVRVVAVAAILVGTAACETRAPYDEIVLYYTAGAGENKAFQECIEPGKSGSYPVDDETFPLPANKRTWNIRVSGGDSSEAIKSGTKPGDSAQPGPEVAVYATADFYLNTDCSKGKDSPIVKLWEDTLRRYGVSSDTGGSGSEDGHGFNEKNWVKALTQTLIPSEEDAIRTQTRKYTADELDANLGDVYARMERTMAPQFQAALKARLGGEFFCGVGYQRGKEVSWTEWVPDGVDDKGEPKVKQETKRGTCPPIFVDITEINYADPKIAEARAKVYAAEQEAKAKLTAANAELAQSNILGQAATNEAYLRFKEIEVKAAAAEACKANPNCTVIIDGTGGAGVNVTSRK